MIIVESRCPIRKEAPENFHEGLSHRYAKRISEKNLIKPMILIAQRANKPRPP
jgi:hypothetical protein